MQNSGIKVRLVSGFAWEAASKVIVQAFSWISTIYVARVLNPADYGVVAISGIFVGMSLMLGGLGLSAGIIQKKDISKLEMDSVFWLSLMLNAAVFSGLFILAPYIAQYYEIVVLTDVIRVAASIAVISGLSTVPRAIKLKELDFKFTSLASLASGFTTTITVFLLAWNGYGLWSLVLSTLAGEFVLTAIYLKKASWRPSMTFQFRKIQPVIRYGVGLMMSRMLQFANSKVGILVSGLSLGEVNTGYFQFSDTLARMPTDKIGGIFHNIAFSSLSKIQDDKILSKDLLFKFHRYLVFMAYPILFGVAYVSDHLIIVLLTEKWLPMSTPLKLVCALAAMSISLQLLPTFLESKGEVRKLFKFQVAMLIITLVAMLFGSQYSLSHMIAAVLLVYPILYIQVLRYVLPMLSSNILEFFKSFYDVFAINALMIVSLFIVSPLVGEHESMISLIIESVVGFSVYFLAAFLFLRKDLYALKAILRR